MNKGRRNELKQLKYFKRLKNLRLNPNAPNSNFHAFKSHGKPCSCWLCRGTKFRDERSKNKSLYLKHSLSVGFS